MFSAYQLIWKYKGELKIFNHKKQVDEHFFDKDYENLVDSE